MPRCRALLSLAAVAALAVPASASASDVTDQIIVKRRAGVDAADNRHLRAEANVTLVRTLPISRVQVVQAESGDRSEALAELREDPRVQWAEPNRVVHGDVVTDTFWSHQWGLFNRGNALFGQTGVAGAEISAQRAWIGSRGDGVTVGVVDSGADMDHPDLQLVPGVDYVDDDTDPQDGAGHGTHVSGIVAAAANAIGVIGVAPGAKVMPLRMLNNSNTGSSADSAAAFAYAGQLGLRVVNASIGASAPTLAEQEAIRQHPGTLYVVSAGNKGNNVDQVPSYPCSYPEANILCVGASDNQDARAIFNTATPATSSSNHGQVGVDLFAPGWEILSTYHLDGSPYVFMGGTSMAAPMVAGAAALLFAYDPQLTAAQVKQTLMDSVDHPAALAGLSQTGGRLNAAAALQRLGADLTPPDETPPSIPSQVAATAGDMQVTVSWRLGEEADLAGFRVYQRTDNGSWPVQPSLQTTGTEVTIHGLENDRWYFFKVTSIDQNGNESAVSSTAMAYPTAPTLPPAPTPDATPQPPVGTPPPIVTPPIPTPPPTRTPQPPAVQPQPPTAKPASGARVESLKVTGQAGSKRGAVLRFSVSADASVTVSLQRQTCRRTRCSWGPASTRTAEVRAGSQRLRIRSSLLGIKLTAGKWRVSVAAAAASRATTFSVRTR